MKKVTTMVGDKKFFFVQPVEHWKMPSSERNISEHDIIQHMKEMRNVFFFVYDKRGWDME